MSINLQKRIRPIFSQYGPCASSITSIWELQTMDLVTKGEVALRLQATYTTVAGSCSKKQLPVEVSLLPAGWDASPS